MLNLADMANILSEVTYKDWRIRLKEDGNLRPYLQVSFLAEDMESGTIEEQRGRKWYLSQFMTKSEVVATALKAVLTAEEHEARESFRYKGRAIFGPHFDVDALYEFVRLSNIDVRTGNWVKEEKGEVEEDAQLSLSA